MVAQTQGSALKVLSERLFETLAMVDRLKDDIAKEITEQTDNAQKTINLFDSQCTPDDLNSMTFREWLKQSVLAQGMTITDFANETGLSRQLCNSSLNKYDPSVANLVLSCEILAEWQGRSLMAVVVDAIQTTKAYKMSAERMQ